MYVKGQTIEKVTIVPITPNKKMYKKYLKKERRRKLYPAAKIIGGSMKVKNISESNFKYFAKLC
jgi:hypothetical protein